MSDILSRLYAWASVGADPFASLDNIEPCAFDADDAAMSAQMSDTDIISLSVFPQSAGCAFGGGRSDELPEIPLGQAVQTCHDISAKINAWACEGCE
jgi:hypothetical protein